MMSRVPRAEVSRVLARLVSTGTLSIRRKRQRMLSQPNPSFFQQAQSFRWRDNGLHRGGTSGVDGRADGRAYPNTVT